MFNVIVSAEVSFFYKQRASFNLFKKNENFLRLLFYEGLYKQKSLYF